MKALVESGQLRYAGGDHEMIGNKPLPEITEAIAARFFMRVNKAGPNGCWVWTGALSDEGYPRSFSASSRRYRASHIALLMAGKMPDAERQLALHSCDNRACVNPAHLRWGTELDNLRDYIQRRPKKAALQEHEVRAIRASSERGVDLAATYNVSPSAICFCRKRVTHKHVD